MFYYLGNNNLEALNVFLKIIFISKTESSTNRPLYVLYAGFRKVRIANSDRMQN